MALWQQTPNLAQLNGFLKHTIGEQLDIRFDAFDDESLTASMVVDARLKTYHAPALEDVTEIEKRVDELALPGRPLYGIL